MIARLWYAGLLALCGLAVWIGLWPSVLTLFALAALPLGVIALLGLVSPTALLQRPRLLRIVRWGAYFLCAEFVLVAAYLTWNRRRPVTLIVREPAPALVRIVYGVHDGLPVSRLAWRRTFEVPASGLVHTRYGVNSGWFDPTNPYPLTVRLVPASGDTISLPGAWLRHGAARGLACQYRYDEIAVGRVASASDSTPAERPDSWLDSTNSWGVTCRDGRLELAWSTQTPPSSPPHEICFWAREGSMRCWSRARAP